VLDPLTSGSPRLAQSNDLLVELCQSLLQNLSVARVLHRVELLKDPAAGKFQSLFAGFDPSLLGRKIAFWLRRG